MVMNRTNHERIIENVNTSMTMEGMPLNKTQKELMLDCLTGKVTYAEVVKNAIDKYRQLNNPDE